MTSQAQAGTPAPAPVQPQAATTPAPPGGLTSGAPVTAPGVAAARSGTSTPQVLRRARSVAVLGVLLVAASSLLATVVPTRGFSAAADDIAHVTALQDASTQIAKAEADAAAAVLAGSDGATQLEQFHATLDSATSVLVLAAARHPDDASQIAAVTTDLSAYRRAVQDASQTAGSGKADVAATRLISATAPLEDGAMAGLDSLISGTQVRIMDATSPTSGWYTLAGWLGVGLVVGAMVMVARRTHRVVNLGLAATVILLAIIANAIGSVNATQSSSAVRARSDVTSIGLLGQLRSLTYSAHAAETRSLISTTTSAQELAVWSAVAAKATPVVASIDDPTVTQRWSDYTGAHATLIATADRAGKITVLTTTSATTVAALDDTLTGDIATTVGSARSALSTSSLAAMAVASGLGSVAALTFASFGVRRRLSEYR